MLQPVGRVVRGADGAHLHPGQQGAGAEGAGGQLGVAGLPDHRGGPFAERLPDPEVALQFQVGPMVERVAHQGRHRPGPGQEGAVVRLVAGDVLFGHAVGPHGAPLVVVAAQPGVGEGLEAGVARHLRRGQVAVVVDDRHVGRVLVEQPARAFVRQQEVGVHEWLHKRHSVLEDGDLPVAAQLGLGALAFGHRDDLPQQFDGQLVEGGAGQHAAGVEIDPARLAGGEVGVGGDLEGGRGRPVRGAAAGGEEDQMGAGGGERGRRDPVVARAGDQGEAALLPALAVADDVHDRHGAGLADAAERLLLQGGDAAFAVAGRRVLVDLAGRSRRNST